VCQSSGFTRAWSVLEWWLARAGAVTGGLRHLSTVITCVYTCWIPARVHLIPNMNMVVTAVTPGCRLPSLGTAPNHRTPHAPNHYTDTLQGSKEITILLHSAFGPTYDNPTLPSLVPPGVKDVFVLLTGTPAPSDFCF